MTDQNQTSSAETADDGLSSTVLTDAAATVDAEAAADTVAGAAGADTTAGAEAADTVAAAGAPEAYDIKPPEGSTLDAKAIEALSPVFKDLNLPNDAAQRLTDAYAKDVLPGLVAQVQTSAQQQLLADIVQTRKTWADEFAKDPEIGGNDQARGEKLALMAKAIDDLMGPKGTPAGDEFRTLLNETGLGNNPVIGRLLYRAGMRLQEAAIHHSQAGTSGERTMAQVMYGPEYQPKGSA